MSDTDQNQGLSPTPQEPYKTSVGEYYVEHFDSDRHGPVEHVKRISADLIDYVRNEGRDPRCTALAVTAIEQASMWAVKSITKGERL